LKTIWLVLLGMILFNFFLMSFSIFFPSSPLTSDVNDYDITQNESISKFKNPGAISIGLIIGSIDIAALLTGGAATILTRDPKFIICGSLVSLSVTLWNGSASVFSNLFFSFKDNIPMQSIFIGVSIGIGFVLTLLVLGILAGQSQVD